MMNYGDTERGVFADMVVKMDEQYSQEIIQDELSRRSFVSSSFLDRMSNAFILRGHGRVFHLPSFFFFPKNILM